MTDGESHRRRYETVAAPDTVPPYDLVPVKGPEGQPLDVYRGVRRRDTPEIVSVVSSRYQLVQHREVAQAVHAISEALEHPVPDPDTPQSPREVLRLFAAGRRLEVDWNGDSFKGYASPAPSEEPSVPAGVRWWNERARRFAREKRGVGERWRRTIRQYLEAMPTAFRRAGRDPPRAPMNVSTSDVEALKEARFWANSTLNTNLVTLREFLRWSGDPVSEDAET